MSELSKAVERLTEQAEMYEGMVCHPAGGGESADAAKGFAEWIARSHAADIRLVLARLAALERECAAWRMFDWENWPEDDPKSTPAWEKADNELRAARAASDEVGK
jgi:hypothetical protein